MTYTAYTAFIITFHHVSFASSIILALIMSALLYWLILRKSPHRVMLFFLAFVIALMAGAYLSEELFLRTPLSIEMVNAG